jgi:ATP-binding cassette, subfamily B, bacterial
VNGSNDITGNLLLEQLLAKHVVAEEQVISTFVGDLTENIIYGQTLCVLTNKRFFAIRIDAKDPKNVSISDEWELSQISGVKAKEQHGLGALELLGHENRLAVWRYTSAKGTAVSRFVLACNTTFAELRGDKYEVVVTVCPSCGAVINSGEAECASCAIATTPQARSIARLFRFAKPHLGMIFLGFGLTLLATLASLVGPYAIGLLIDHVLIPNFESHKDKINFASVSPYLIAYLAAAFFAWLLGWSNSYVLNKVSEYIVSDVRRTTYSHLQKLSLEFFGGKRTGDLISRVSSDSDRINNFLAVQVLDFSRDIFMISLTSCMLLSLDPWLAMVTLLPFPAIAWTIQVVRSRLRQGFASGSRAWSEMVSVLTDTIPGIRVVKAFAQETREINRFKTADEYVVTANMRVNRVWSFFTPIITLLTEIGLFVIWAFGAWQIAAGSITVGELTVFATLIGRFYGRLESMSRMIASVQRTAVATHRIFEILDRTPSVAEPVKAVHPGRLQGRIELKGVRFSYGKREVIKGVDLVIEPGEMIGLVGPSGAGKSTLVNLVCRFYDVAAGAIFADAHDIRSFPTEEYRSNIGIVLQDPFLFYGTIAENIAYGDPQATRRQIIEAAKAAKAHEFILRLPDGYDSLVGERGQSLSGGERQRISIARALLTDPRILILDEATSSVDTETEREIQEALDNLTRGRTTIAIAHRLSTLRNANRIVVLESGQITELGSHEELILKAGTYARLCQSQHELHQ